MKLAMLAMLPLLYAVPADGLQQKARPAPAAPTTATITVTDRSGAPLAEVDVTLTGGLDRSGSTQTDGTVRFDTLRPGVYRLLFEKEGYVPFEREIEVRAGQPAPTPQVALTALPPAPKEAAPPPEPAKPASPALPPPGKPSTVGIPDFIERNFISNNQPQKVSSVGCSGMANAVLWQIREPWENRQHPNSDAMLYVVGGEGTLRLDGRDVAVQAGSFATVPRGMSYGLVLRGRNPLIFLATLAGEPCSS